MGGDDGVDERATALARLVVRAGAPSLSDTMASAQAFAWCFLGDLSLLFGVRLRGAAVRTGGDLSKSSLPASSVVLEHGSS